MIFKILSFTPMLKSKKWYAGGRACMRVHTHTRSSAETETQKDQQSQVNLSLGNYSLTPKILFTM